MGICIKNFCTSSNECGVRYTCLQGSCVLNGCKNDFECGSKHVCHQCQDCDKGEDIRFLKTIFDWKHLSLVIFINCQKLMF